MSDLTTPLPKSVRRILKGVYNDFDGHITALYHAKWLTGGEEHRWIARMEEDLDPLWDLLEEDKKLRDSK